MAFKEILRARAKKAQSTKAIGKINPYDVIIKPVFTGKVHQQMEQMDKYAFQVHPEANKNDIKYALKTVYNVDAKQINIIKVKTKGRAHRKLVRRPYTKALVSLQSWQKIELVK